ncbi:tetratricopeptide repeat protein [Massilia pseudoviolaceinigra]|uniref:tetratricopeptide repeat protein n=1 Tax=Massilia pseudoviolaceinigra TaxID=3057165 RepID=UPI0027968898|nr:tetratricopeptide repeat protein [Massilia sp. CCM 9206]MDQ1919927.1 tetratricopeptide repeat protein [Massilia sp. CCM 9206]
MKNAFVIVTLSGLLSACAVAPTPHAPALAGSAADAQADAPAPAATAEPLPPAAEVLAEGERASAPDEPSPDLKLPHVALTKEMLYKLMKAELEFRGGTWQGPYMTLMALAQQTRDPRLAQRAAEMAQAAQKGSEALAAIRLWRELAPESDEAGQYYIAASVMADDLGEAGELFAARLRDAAPANRGMAMYQIQQLLTRAKDKAAAGALLERLLAPYIAMSEARVVLAQSAYARGASDEALAHAQEALRIKPDSEIAVLTLAQVSGEQGDVGSLLAKFLAANPGAREVRAALARILVTQKQYEPARKEFLALLKEQPDNPGTLYALGILSMQLSDPAAAETYLAGFITALDKNPGDERDPAKVLIMLSQLAEDRGDLAAARAWLGKIEPEDAPAWFSAQLRSAQLMGKQGDLDGARAFLGALKAEEPAQQVQVVLVQSQVLRDAGKIDEAYAVMEQGAARFPSNPDLLYDFALLAEKLGRVDVMEKNLRMVMEQAPDNHHAYNALGYSLAERNVRLDEALALIDKALKMAPSDPFIMDSMGWVQYRLGNLNEAEAHLRRAYALRNDPEIAVHLGEVLWHKGQKSDAQQLWREARAKDPKNDTLKSTLARLQLKL